MAFQAPHLGQEKQNRKILEQLEEQKKRLRMAAQGGGAVTGGGGGGVAGGGPPSTANLTPTTPTPMMASLPQGSVSMQTTSVMNVVHSAGEQGHMTPQQRAALQHAHANSVGYFITQDSSFGNLILPVLPRFDPPPKS